MYKNWFTDALHPDNPAARGFRSDFDLNPSARAGGSATIKPYQGRKAAVLVPIVERESGLHVILTKRGDQLPTHAGQVSFPGGKIDSTDPSAKSAALREAKEEINLTPELVKIMGRLDTYETSTGFHITPFVGFIERGNAMKLQAEPGEVAEIFEVPLAFLLDQRNHQIHSKEYLGQERHYYAMPYGDYYIWGATAAMLVNLSEVMQHAVTEGSDLLVFSGA